mgnify:CR=1 FL=1
MVRIACDIVDSDCGVPVQESVRSSKHRAGLATNYALDGRTSHECMYLTSLIARSSQSEVADVYFDCVVCFWVFFLPFLAFACAFLGGCLCVRAFSLLAGVAAAAAAASNCLFCEKAQLFVVDCPD